MFGSRRLISSTVPRIFLSSYLILRQSDLTPPVYCINSINSSISHNSRFNSTLAFISGPNSDFGTNIRSIKDLLLRSKHQESASGSTHTSRDLADNNGKEGERNHKRTNRMSEHYDLVVLGAGPGGMAAAKEAASLGKKTLLFDFVKPSPRGTTWGVGGTCVNVGCIPKKLMHYAATLRSANVDRYNYGLTDKLEDAPVDWPKLVKNVQNHVKMLNFTYRVSLNIPNLTYVNAYATLKDSKTVEYELKGETKTATGDKIIIAVGERPYIPHDVEGAREYAITSDDLFSLPKAPGKTLVIGASYVALECAGFLAGLGFDVNVSVRSILLRGFDRQCVDKVQELMQASGVGFLFKKLPEKIEKSDGRCKVTFTDGSVDFYDTVMYATGRMPLDDVKNYKSLGLEFDNSYNLVTHNEKTNLDDIYAVGDIVSNKPKLAPVAIKAGELLAQRLFNNSTVQMKYEDVPVCLYTPFEYSSCGLTEEEAIARYGEDGIEVYLKEYTNLEVSAAHRVNKKTNDDFDFPLTCLTKVICLKDDTIVGIHFVGPNAGEIMQGFSVLLPLKAKKKDLDRVVGIHPTDAESFMDLTVTKSSKKSWIAKGGCAGGKCG
ncbi:thioredoxin reductase [Theileria orientalis]|uniref:thioredoxin-disulfide reductase (NADPH) n=1 Tax=Theileria orientalis TaxID=68886 RepID=A0A976M640_THEOR|nr:thioredoxin reductase [Theileria orientalis]